MEAEVNHTHDQKPIANGVTAMSNHSDGHEMVNHRAHSHSKEKSSSSHKSSSSGHREGSSHSSKHKEGSSSSSQKHSSSSSKHRDGDGSRHSSGGSSRPKDSSSSSGDKHKSSSSHSSSSDRHKESSSSSKDREHSSHKSSSKTGSSSGSSKPKDGSSSKHSSASDRDKSKSSSSSSSRPKDGHSSSKPKDGSHSSKSRENSHSSKPKESSSSSSKSKESSHSSKLQDGSHSSKPKDGSDKHKERSKDEVALKERKPMTIKTETVEPVNDMYASPTVKREPMSPVKVKKEEEAPESEDEIPLSKRKMLSGKVKVEKRSHQEDTDDEPLEQRVKKVKKEKEAVKKEKETVKKLKRPADESEDDQPLKKKKKTATTPKTPVKEDPKKKRVKKEEEPNEVWRWWEEERRDDGVKWTFLEHKGPVFAPAYEPLPSNVHFYYDGKKMRLSEPTEEVATFYGRMLDHDYTTKEIFNKNFFKDWRKVMNAEELEKIKDLSKCNFKEIDQYFKMKSEERKAMSKEEKKKIKEQNDEITQEYGYCTMDGHKEKIGNFKIEPPGLFRGRGDHPKQGMLKRRTMPEDVIINCSKDSKIPVPPSGHKWKEVRHDNTVTWLCSWNENIQGSTKYIMLNANSRLKGEKDWQKYETARRLHKSVDKIRAQYRDDWKSKEMRIRQRAVALYFIDKLALRAGNEKEEGETADTVGCCSLRVEHLTLHPEKDGKEYVVDFDFLGKDSIRYLNSVAVEKRVFKNLELFMDGKSGDDDVFDRLNTAILNKYLHELMEGLTAKVFRTYNASRTLQEQLDILTQEDDPVPTKLLSYNRANRAVAVLCNHQRAVPKNFSKQMENLQNKIDAKHEAIRDARKNVKAAKADYKAVKNEKNKSNYERKKKQLERLEDQLTKLEVQATDKDENKEIALGTSKLNYLDPRISVSWCKKWEVPIEKIYNKTQRDKFKWAIDMAGPDFVF